ncbi:MAG: hypothetical protein WA206_11750, partial [Candidatus Binatus sp.]
RISGPPANLGKVSRKIRGDYNELDTKGIGLLNQSHGRWKCGDQPNDTLLALSEPDPMALAE